MSEETKAPEATKATEETPEPVDPRIEKANGQLELVKSKVVAKFGEEVIEEALLAKFQPTLVIQNERWADVVEFLKVTDELGFVYPEAMAGTDHMAKGYFEVYLYLHSFVLDMDLAVKVRTGREEPSIPSVTHLFSGVNWEEREIFDLLGVPFTGHPDMRRIMLEDHWQGHPLRKDYVVKD
ncbi:NADH-quinone oxidoreductase subunit C [Tumebacillus lipolyticus]|uniref:NADH-quinone oxidoreductase n=1 Tax=Tumebacillus lipolyticus TaxID=1280370 RepID=A0ABW4ZW03_9BACL